MTKIFLQAEWRKLAMANYEVDPKILEPYLPSHTELDAWNGRYYVSLVGFMFLNTRVLGLKIPFHINFEEVNLRFYVRYKSQEGWKRGVVFIKEIVPRHALTFVANTLYNEHYETLPMTHRWEEKNNGLLAEYQWKKAQKWNTFLVQTGSVPQNIADGSEEEFITEHYWGYTSTGKNKTSEYGVEHPRWQVYKTTDYVIDVDFRGVYGDDFAFLQSEIPKSVFLAEGSEVLVKSGIKI